MIYAGIQVFVQRSITQTSRLLIPAGKYRVIIDHSNRFNRDLPLLINVAGFTGIRIHRGNSASVDDTFLKRFHVSMILKALEI